MSQVPAQLKYSKSHEWMESQTDGTVKVGITDYAQDQLGDLVYIGLPECDKPVKQGEECVVIESVKTASDLYSPINGKIIAVNDQLTDQPELINTDAYGEGWIITIQPDNAADLENDFLDAAQYQSQIEE